MNDETLTQALARHDLRHEPSGFQTRRILDASGAVVLDGADVVAGWTLVRELDGKQVVGE